MKRMRWFSPIFLVPKSDGKYTLILNLKSFNESVAYEHFKMEDLRTATNMMTKGCYMASVDLRHAYYSVRVNTEYQNFFEIQMERKALHLHLPTKWFVMLPKIFHKTIKTCLWTFKEQGVFINSLYR